MLFPGNLPEAGPWLIWGKKDVSTWMCEVRSQWKVARWLSNQALETPPLASEDAGRSCGLARRLRVAAIKVSHIL